MNIVIPVALVAVVGLLASCMLSYASKVFAVQEDQLFLDLRAELPGANCGGCGFAGCDDYAHAMAEGGETPCTKCSVGGPAVAKKLASLLGQIMLPNSMNMRILIPVRLLSSCSAAARPALTAASVSVTACRPVNSTRSASSTA